MMSSFSGDSVPAKSVQQEPSRTEAAEHSESQSGGILGAAKGQIDSLTGGVSVAEMKDNVAGAAGEKVTRVKETVLDDAVPAATGALQSAQDKIRSLAGGHDSEQGTWYSEYALWDIDLIWLT